MHTVLNTRLQQVGAHVMDDFIFDETDYYLSAAQRQVVQDRIQQGAGSPEQISSEDLYPVISEDILLPLLDATLLPEGVEHEYLCTWPEDFMKFMSGESKLTRTANPEITTAEYVQNVVITEDAVKRYRVNTEHRPYIRNPRVLPRENFIHVFCDEDTTLTKQKIVYVRSPLDINLDMDNSHLNQDPELPVHLHDEIVERALRSILRDLNATPSEGGGS